MSPESPSTDFIDEFRRATALLERVIADRTLLMQVDGQESLQVINVGEEVLRLYVSISPMGSEAFATDANV